MDTALEAQRVTSLDQISAMERLEYRVLALENRNWEEDQRQANEGDSAEVGDHVDDIPYWVGVDQDPQTAPMYSPPDPAYSMHPGGRLHARNTPRETDERESTDGDVLLGNDLDHIMPHRVTDLQQIQPFIPGGHTLPPQDQSGQVSLQGTSIQADSANWPNAGAAGIPADSHRPFTIPGVEVTSTGPKIAEDHVFDYLEGTPPSALQERNTGPNGQLWRGSPDMLSDGLTPFGVVSSRFAYGASNSSGDYVFIQTDRTPC